MTWFDILKLGGEDLVGGERKENVGNEDSKHDYDDTHNLKETYFYNLKDKNVTTRPHFEWQAKNKFPTDRIDGDLKAIADLINGRGTIGNRYFGFTSEVRDHLITWNIVGKEKEYTSSGSKLRPIDLGHENKVVVFDSVYRVMERQNANLEKAIFMPLFPNDKEEWNNIKGTKFTVGRKGDVNIYTLGDWNKENIRLNEKLNGARRAGNFESFKDYEQQIADHKEKDPRNQKANINKPRKGKGLRFRKSLDWFEKVLRTDMIIS